jgi:hypothetical protein
VSTRKFAVTAYIALGLGWVGIVSAEPATTLHEVRTLKELPQGVRDGLGTREGMSGIVDRGEDFNASDVMTAKRPSRRFMIAGVDADRAIVAFEQGGIALRIVAMSWSNVGGTWTQKSLVYLHSRPDNLSELLRAVADANAGGSRSAQQHQE